uniref:Sin3 histone deacetylase corepressor complex component SDS3 n=1 Tax=Anopheles christyi TaxID=43041 RepID=A0A182K5Q9_9DIPT
MKQHPENVIDSGEETEDAAPSDSSFKSGCQRGDRQLALYEHRYREERARIMLELDQLRQGTHWKYLKVTQCLQDDLDDRLRLNEIELENSLAAVEREYIQEIAAAEEEFEEKKAELIADAIAGLENERKAIVYEFATMGLSECSGETTTKAVAPRKLRSRVNEPYPVQHKKPSQMKFLLDEEDIVKDLGIIFADAAAAQHGVNYDGK